MPVLNMLEQIKIDFIKHNEQTIFTECDEIKNYSYYFSNFNMDRVLLKIQMELLRRKKKLLSSVSDDMNWKKLKEKTFNK